MNKLSHWLIAGLAGICFASTAAAANPQVEIKTSLGDIVVELYPEKAPKTVENFLQYVRDGFYKDTIFHRVKSNFMIQGGMFTKDFQAKTPRAPIQNEADNLLRNERGTIAMARTSNINSATAQFFINHVDNRFLNFTAPTSQGYGYCVFGKVVKGMDVVDQIAAIPTGPNGPFPADVPTRTVVIENARIISE